MNSIYLDNSATTKPCKEAVSAMEKAMTSVYGNPSSVHGAGCVAAQLLLDSRNEIMCALFGENMRNLLPATPVSRSKAGAYGNVFFTAGGTESDNTAIFGTLAGCGIENPEIVTTDSEHPAVLNSVKYLETKGVKVHYLKTVGGIVSEDELKSKLNGKTALVSVMHTNNETGAVYDVGKLFSEVKKINKNIVCHTDCVQSFQKQCFTPFTLNADMVTVSAHKVHGPKGVGALWISENLLKKKMPLPLIYGGGQESGLRSGTENLPGIAAFAAAVKANGGCDAWKNFDMKTSRLRQLIRNGLPDECIINESVGKTAPHIVSISLPVVKSEPVLNLLSSEGVYISAGSACSSHGKKISHVLRAFGLDDKTADATVRVSTDTDNSESDIEVFCEKLRLAVKRMHR